MNKPDPWDTARPRRKSHSIPAMAWDFPKWAVCGPQNRVSPYNEILAFYYSGAALVHEYGTGSVVGFEEETGGFAMNLHTLIFTNNACYKAGPQDYPQGHYGA